MEYKPEQHRPDRLQRRKGPEKFQTDRRDPARAVVLHIERKSREKGHLASAHSPAQTTGRSSEAKLEEAVGLARAIDLDVVHTQCISLAKIQPATLLGQGKVDELKGVMAALDIELAIVNATLTPVQQRNLERAWDTKILDRTGLILEIFGDRARTKEGRLQVELAHLTYQKSRLVRSWTHLERQRGGLGFVGGPGETQIEADRRMIQERISRLERQLETVKRTRKLHRSSRQKVPFPVVALVGYTNAGKSTLFNKLTDAGVFAQDLLFATLDPTMREAVLPSGGRIVLSDTVGFISDLPTDLIAAFRATLEEVLEADIVLHVRDITHVDSQAQAGDVNVVLRELGFDEHRLRNVIEIWNKSDQLTQAERGIVEERMARAEATVVLTSAVTGEGLDAVFRCLGEILSKDCVNLDLVLDGANGAGLHWLYENGEVLARDEDTDGSVHVRVRLSPAKAGAARDMFGAEIAAE